MILYEDKEILVCRKPAGIAVQSARIGEKDLVSILNNHLAEQANMRETSGNDAKKKKASGGAGFEPIRVVHRLDQPVEGVLVFAKTKKAAAGLSKQVTDGTMKKTYHAVCCVTGEGQKWLEDAAETVETAGSDAQARQRDKAEAEINESDSMEKEREEGRWHTLTDYLVKDAGTNTSSVTEKGRKEAKEARLSFRIAARLSDLVLAEIELDTGRHHQIRVQMAHAGLPLYGDVKYNAAWRQYVTDGAAHRIADKEAVEETGKTESDGCSKVERKILESGSSGRPGKMEPALCASRLEFVHPTTGKKMAFETKPEREIFRVFDR